MRTLPLPLPRQPKRPQPFVPEWLGRFLYAKEAIMGRGLLLWLIGVPIPVILLLWLFFGR